MLSFIVPFFLFIFLIFLLLALFSDNFLVGLYAKTFSCRHLPAYPHSVLQKCFKGARDGTGCRDVAFPYKINITSSSPFRSSIRSFCCCTYTLLDVRRKRRVRTTMTRISNLSFFFLFSGVKVCSW